MPKRQIDWTPFLFLTVTPILALITIPIYFHHRDLTWPIALLTFVYWWITGLCITGGYHRLFAHRSYEASKLVKAFYLFFGAATFENSVLVWAINHRRHHRKVDTDEDPYTIKKGFFYAHIGWMLFKNENTAIDEVPNDLKDPMVQIQHKYYVAIAVTAGFLLPAAIGYALADFWGGLLLAGLGRMVVVHHATFFINSLAHMVGSQTYSTANTAKDSTLIALLTYGEGYHNFHHAFEADYRNGIRWFHFDPGKWMIRAFEWFGHAKNLKRVPDDRILVAKMNVQYSRLKNSGVDMSQMDMLKEKFSVAQKRFRELMAEYDNLKQNFHERSQARMEQIGIEIKIAQLEVEATIKQWRACFSALQNATPSMA